VETEDCASGTAKLVKVLGTGLHNTDPPPATWGNIQIDGCQYGWYAQYECVVPEIADYHKPVLCGPEGCDDQTCCKQLTCGDDFLGTCSKGQNPVDHHTNCDCGACTQEICCEQKSCAVDFAHGCAAGFKPKAEGTMCTDLGCDVPTCCLPLTCGRDYGGDCDAGEKPVCADTVCVNGPCTQAMCCAQRTCADSYDACTGGYVPKPAGTLCLSAGCDQSTCCNTLTCGKDFHEACDPGEQPGNPDAMCTSGECNKVLCCVPKVCYESFPSCGAGWKAKEFGTKCLAQGCDQKTCCSQVTCSADFPQGCGAWNFTKPLSTQCTSGTCTEATCCEKNPDVIPDMECNDEAIESVEHVSYDVTEAMKECNARGRAKCFGIMDKDCSGQSLSFCKPRNENDPKDVVLRPAKGACTYFIYANKTCGYHFHPEVVMKPGAQVEVPDSNPAASEFSEFSDARCDHGQTVPWYHVCTEGICTSAECCVPLKCEEAFFDCVDGYKPNPISTMCLSSGCDTKTCCTQLTCGSDFGSNCGAWDKRKSDDTICLNGPCDEAKCCEKNPDILPDTECDGDGHAETVEFAPGASETNDPVKAAASCDSQTRKDCYAIEDKNCDGKNLRICKAKKENDPQYMVTAPHNKTMCSAEAVATKLAENVYACGGSWTEAGMKAGETKLCASDAQLCTYDQMQVVSKSTCDGLQGFFGTGVSSSGYWACQHERSAANDVWGCGNTCTHHDATCGIMSCAIGNTNTENWMGLTHNTEEFDYATHGKGVGGVICCKAPQKVESTKGTCIRYRKAAKTCGYDFLPATCMDGEDLIYDRTCTDVTCNREHCCERKTCAASFSGCTGSLKPIGQAAEYSIQPAEYSSWLAGSSNLGRRLATAADPYCVKVDTCSTPSWCGGFVQVMIDTGSGPVQEASDTFYIGSPVLHKCFPTAVKGIQIKSTSSNGWGGSIKYSKDVGYSYSTMVCTNCAHQADTGAIGVDSDPDNGNWGDFAACLNGQTCQIVEATTTCGGNACGATCHFPFTYNGEKYTKCTSVGNDRPWCFTDSTMTLWGACDCENAPAVPADKVPKGDTKLAAYWDYGCCGPHGDDHHWSWCNQQGFECAETVSTTECESGTARLVSVLGNGKYNAAPKPWGDISINGCDYAYYAQYECEGAVAFEKFGVDPVLCLQEGGDADTCCEEVTCGKDYYGTCDAGEDHASADTVCPTGECAKELCCVRKVCADAFNGCTETESWKPNVKGTLCQREGCDHKTCCLPLTCGVDYKGECSAGQEAVNSQIPCTTGPCTQDLCCRPKVCADSFAGCVQGFVPKCADTTCEAAGCDK
jgi:hypothetical protein